MENSNIPTGKLSNVKKLMDAIQDETQEPVMKDLDLEELRTIADRVKSTGWDVKEYSTLWGVFAIPMTLITALMVNKYGYYYAIPWALFVVYFLYQKSTISTKLNASKLDEVFAEKGFISAMQWVKDGADIRSERIKYSYGLLTLFLPVIIWYGVELVKGKLEGYLPGIVLGVAVLVCAVLWHFFFKNDRAELGKIYRDIESLKGHFVSRGAV